MGKLSGLIHKKHRRGKKRRDRLRLAARVALYVVVLGCAAGLSAGIVHVVERPVPPFKGLATPPPETGPDGLAGADEASAAAVAAAVSVDEAARDPETTRPVPDPAPTEGSERSELATASLASGPKTGRPLR